MHIRALSHQQISLWLQSLINFLQIFTTHNNSWFSTWWITSREISSHTQCHKVTRALTHPPPPDKMAVISQTIFSYAFSWMKSLSFWLKFHWSLFLRSNWQYPNIGLDNGLAPNRRQAIILTNNADAIHWRIHAALGGDELSDLNLVSVPVKHPWRLWVNSSYTTKNYHKTTRKQNTTKLWAYFDIVMDLN